MCQPNYCNLHGSFTLLMHHTYAVNVQITPDWPSDHVFHVLEDISHRATEILQFKEVKEVVSLQRADLVNEVTQTPGICSTGSSYMKVWWLKFRVKKENKKTPLSMKLNKGVMVIQCIRVWVSCRLNLYNFVKQLKSIQMTKFWLGSVQKQQCQCRLSADFHYSM